MRKILSYSAPKLRSLESETAIGYCSTGSSASSGGGSDACDIGNSAGGYCETGGLVFESRCEPGGSPSSGYCNTGFSAAGFLGCGDGSTYGTACDMGTIPS